MGTIAATLATIAASTYSGTLAGLPPGFSPLSAPALTNGAYANQNAYGAAVTGTFGNQSVVVLSFRGSDDRQDWINNLRNINADYDKLSPLITAVDSYAAISDSTVIITGHSLGGALAQVFMANHPGGGDVVYQATTFGSPGALISSAPDDRIINYEISDDPVPYLGIYRAEIGHTASSDLIYASTLSVGLSTAIGNGVTPQDVAGSIPSLTTDYVNRGAINYLPGVTGAQTTLTQSKFLDAGSFVDTFARYGTEHDVSLYVSRSSGSSVVDPVIQSSSANTGHPDPVFRFFDTKSGDHFYTTSVTEKAQIQATIPTFTYEGSPWSAPDGSANTHDVFRFFDTKTGTHFFTDNVNERDTVIATIPNYKYEGVAFEAYNDVNGPGHLTLERFFNTQTGQHHFAGNAEEAAGINQGAAGPGWIDEGKAFTVHVPTDGMLLL
jgi:pimeloyl-ACP methyl ester carboxylesterase